MSHHLLHPVAFGALPMLVSAKTRSISAENPTGGKGAGAREIPETGKSAASDLGKGWKVRLVD